MEKVLEICYFDQMYFSFETIQSLMYLLCNMIMFVPTLTAMEDQDVYLLHWRYPADQLMCMVIVAM